MYQVNAVGPQYMVRSVVPHMPPDGRIINITSPVAKMGHGILSTYAASKAALENLTLSWAEELGRSKCITVNAVAPDLVFADIVPPKLEGSLVKHRVERTKVADRVGTTADVADAVLLLVNEKSRWITGQNISVSGGVTNQTVSVVVTRAPCMG